MTMTLAKGGVYSQHGTCAIVERGLMCGKPIKKDGFCNMHYTRKVRHGNVHAVKNNSGGTPLERFMRTTERQSDGCLHYTGTIRKPPKGDGHGAFWAKDVGVVLAHRWIWEQTVGPIPEGMTLDHECHNKAAWRGECDGGPNCLHRRCVDINHLTVKPPGENAMASANWVGHKTHCKNGHAFDEANTHVAEDGRRVCRACHRTWERERRARLRARERNTDG